MTCMIELVNTEHCSEDSEEETAAARTLCWSESEGRAEVQERDKSALWKPHEHARDGDTQRRHMRLPIAPVRALLFCGSASSQRVH
ncbi:hypothetical protein BGY98DRAFT_1001711, partial [Russula aff. rugulosa BPL654]